MIRHAVLGVVAGACAVSAVAFLALRPSDPALASASQPAVPAQDWSAAAPGTVEPRSGFLHLGFPDAGRIAEMRVRVGDAVQAGDVLVRLVDDEQTARIAAAKAELAFRIADRGGPAGRAGGDDPVRLGAEAAVAGRALAKAEAELAAAETPGPDGARADVLPALQEAVTAAQAALQDRQEALRIAEATAATRAAPDRKSAAVDAARADLALARAEAEKSVITAPVAGTVLEVVGQVGELVSIEPVVTLGEAGPPSVRADLDASDAGKVRLGDEAVVLGGEGGGEVGRGRVVDVAPMIGRRPPGAAGSGAASLSDTQKIRVELEAPAALLPGTRVDVFFHSSDASTKGALR